MPSLIVQPHTESLPCPLHPLTIVLPIYNALVDLQLCLSSVLRTSTPPYHLLLINDASPDPEVAPFLDTLLDYPQITVLTNAVNLGFVGTVNRGMQYSHHDAMQHDVILLNSDTIVTQGWLDKFRRMAQHDASIATATPWSNNAEICSFPNFCQDNGWTAAQMDAGEAERLNQACADSALPSYPDIPTGVGFCMYIRRAVLNELGLFDEVAFKRGYGEENDFCMRVLKAGYRNVLLDDTFVVHTGSKSFSTDKAALAEANMKILLDKHPDYLTRVMAFIHADPLASLRRLIAGRLVQLPIAGEPQRMGILHVLHNPVGGTGQHVAEVIAQDLPLHALSSPFRHCVLIATGDTWTLTDHAAIGTPSTKITRLPDEPWGAFLGHIVTQWAIGLIHVHHLLGQRAGMLLALSETSIPYGVTIHDFYLACPTINLLNQNGVYCHAEIDPQACTACLKAQPSLANFDIKAWRQSHEALLARAAFVLAPSQSTADTITHYFPECHPQVLPHPPSCMANNRSSESVKFMALPPFDGITVGVLGAIGPVKGARQLEVLVSMTRAQKLPIRWLVIGYTDTHATTWQSPDGVLVIHGPYQPAELPHLIHAYGIQCAVFPSAGPETFCYTLSEAWTAGLPAIVPRFTPFEGALAERVQAKAGSGWVYPAGDMAALLAAIQQLIPTRVASRDGELPSRPSDAIKSYSIISYDMASYDTVSYDAISRHAGVSGVAASEFAASVRRQLYQTHGKPLCTSSPSSVSFRQRLLASPASISPPRLAWHHRLVQRLRYSRLGSQLLKAMSPSTKARMRAWFMRP